MPNPDQKVTQAQAITPNPSLPAHNIQKHSEIESISPNNPLEVSPMSEIINSPSPTAIIIAITVLLSVVIPNITKLVSVILILSNKPSK